MTAPEISLFLRIIDEAYEKKGVAWPQSARRDQGPRRSPSLMEASKWPTQYLGDRRTLRVLEVRRPAQNPWRETGLLSDQGLELVRASDSHHAGGLAKGRRPARGHPSEAAIRHRRPDAERPEQDPPRQPSEERGPHLRHRRARCVPRRPDPIAEATVQASEPISRSKLRGLTRRGSTNSVSQRYIVELYRC